MSTQNRGNPRAGTGPLVETIVPKGVLVQLAVDQVKPSASNPRRLFDPEPLRELKESIRLHGVLVPILVYKLAGQDKYAIVDGERRYRCCVELENEGQKLKIPANVVDTPNKMAALIYMFNIHSFREQWELMPTALSLHQVMKDLGTDDTKELHEITGLSVPQIERCKLILSFPQSFQELSLEEDTSKRIPSNFWVELHPVLQETETLLPDLYPKPGRHGITTAMVTKYRAKKIKSVIHFRRIMEAIDAATTKSAKARVARSLQQFIEQPNLETRQVFDVFIQDTRRVQRVVAACERFLVDIRRTKIDFAIDGKDDMIAKLLEVVDYAQKVIDRLRGNEPPEEQE